MTEKQILELAETFGITPNKYKVCIIWKDELLKFARELCDNAKWEGYYEGYEQCSFDMGDENV